MKYTFEEHLRYNADKFPEGFLELLTQKPVKMGDPSKPSTWALV